MPSSACAAVAGPSTAPLAARKDTTVAALCDVDANVLAAAAGRRREGPGQGAPHRRGLPPRARRQGDRRRLHRHAAPLALPDRPARPWQAGKHVYVEKPASHVYREGQLLVQAAEQVQAGRAARHADALQRGDRQGPRAARIRHPRRRQDGQGVERAAAHATARRSRTRRRRRASTTTSGSARPRAGPSTPTASTATGSGSATTATATSATTASTTSTWPAWAWASTACPIRITAHGSRIDLKGEREYPDNMMVTYQFDNDKVLIYEDRGWTPYGMHGVDSGNAFYGTKGYMIFSRRGYFQVYLDRKGTKGPGMTGRHRQRPAPAELPRLRPQRPPSPTPTPAPPICPAPWSTSARSPTASSACCTSTRRRRRSSTTRRPTRC